MRHLLDRQVLFFGGKGGVGKTTCASAVALWASRAGKRVLLVSTDPAHSTSDIFGMHVGSSEAELLPSLFALEIDAGAEARQYVARVKERAIALFGEGSAGRALQQIDLASSMPGIEDAALFDRVSTLINEQTGRYDLTIFDTAPTGHTLQMLRTPEAMSSWLRALATSRRAMLSSDRRDTDEIVTQLEDRISSLQQFRARLISGATTAFVLVLIPERLPIDETARTAEHLADSGIRVGSIVVNRVIPESATGDFIDARRRQERVHLAEIERLFAGYHRSYLPQQPKDVHGLDDLDTIARTIFATSR